MNILQICPSHMSYVATLPWEIQKVIIIIISIFTPGSKDPRGWKLKMLKSKCRMVIGPAGQLPEYRAKVQSWSVVAW